MEIFKEVIFEAALALEISRMVIIKPRERLTPTNSSITYYKLHFRRELNKANPQFMAGVPGVRAVTENRHLRQVQSRVQDMCGWRKSGFPGAQPVSLDRENIAFLSQRPYKVHN